MVCRMYSCKVKDDPTAHKMDVRMPTPWFTIFNQPLCRQSAAAAARPYPTADGRSALHRPYQLAFEDFLDAAAEAEGCAGASRLVCKSAWDYKLILKFEDSAAIEGFMKSHHDSLTKEFMPAIKALAVEGKVHEQNFVCE